MTTCRIEVAALADGRFVVLINGRRHNGTFADRQSAVRSAKALARRYAPHSVFEDDAVKFPFRHYAGV